MATNVADEKLYLCSNSFDKGGEDEEEEALSLSDLPTNEEKQSNQVESQTKEAQEDFNFRSWGASVLAESEMCSADEVFFQGQILPFRHSVSSESGLAMFRNDSLGISRSQSMDRCFSGGFTSASSTRSSSIRSHNSSSSAGLSTTRITRLKPPRVENHFHSHPSPKPQIRVSNIRNGNSGHSRSHNKSTIWSFFQVGLVRTPPDLKILRQNMNSSKKFGSRSSNSSSSSSGKNKDFCNNEKRKKQRFFDKNGTLILGGCKCSVDAVETVHPRVFNIRSCSLKDSHSHLKVEKVLQETKKKKKKKTGQQQGKQAMSRHRTFEWLKQLSLEGGIK